MNRVERVGPWGRADGCPGVGSPSFLLVVFAALVLDDITNTGTRGWPRLNVQSCMRSGTSDSTREMTLESDVD